MPFSTFRETGGLLRFVNGQALASLLFAVHYCHRRVLDYNDLWLEYKAFLLEDQTPRIWSHS